MSRDYGLRAYLAELRRLGQVVDVWRAVSTDLEMGAMVRLSCETGNAACVFDNIAESPGFRAVGALLGTSAQPGRELVRLASALFLPPEAGAAEIVDELARARAAPGICPRQRPDAPFQDNTARGDDVDLSALPVPLLHHGDGGRYLNTLGLVVTRSPDGVWTNWSINRIMLAGDRGGVGSVVPVQHIGMILEEWRKIGRDMPFAVAMGVDPALLYAASMPVPRGVPEADFAGALLGRPVETTPTADGFLAVPTDAEIVLEGTVSLHDIGLEGPYGDYTGYFHPNYPVPQPMFYVNGISWRDVPLYAFSCAGEPSSEEHTVWGTASAAEALYRLRAAGLPVTTAWSPFASSNGWLVVTVPETWRDVTEDPKEFCRQIAETVWSCKAGDPVNSVIVTEDDIDPSDLDELVWAIDSRNDRSPGGRLNIADRIGWPMSPYLDTDHFRYFEGWLSSRLIYDCLPGPQSWPPVRTAFARNYPQHVRERVLRHWTEDGFVGPAARSATT